MTHPDRELVEALTTLAVSQAESSVQLKNLYDATVAEAAAREHKVTAIQNQTKWLIALVALVFVALAVVGYTVYDNNQAAEERSRIATEQRQEQKKIVLISTRCDVASETVQQYDACLEKSGL